MFTCDKYCMYIVYRPSISLWNSAILNIWLADIYLLLIYIWTHLLILIKLKQIYWEFLKYKLIFLSSEMDARPIGFGLCRRCRRPLRPFTIRRWPCTIWSHRSSTKRPPIAFMCGKKIVTSRKVANLRANLILNKLPGKRNAPILRHTRSVHF